LERNIQFLRKIDHIFGAALLFFIGIFRRKREQPKPVFQIGIFSFAAIGDSILSSVLLLPLREKFPGVKIIIFCSKANSAVYQLIEGYDDLVILPITNPLRCALTLKKYSVDILIDTSQWFRLGALYACAVRAKWTIGFKTSKQRRHYAYDVQVAHSSHIHEIENFRNLIKPLGCISRDLFKLRKGLSISDNLDSLNLSDDFIVFHPWASGSSSSMRECPNQFWRDLAQELINRKIKVYISGSAADAKKSLELIKEIGLQERVEDLSGKVSLKEFAAVLVRAKACVSVNTGIAHLSASLGRPTIALNGPTNSKRWGIRGLNAINVDVSEREGGAFLNLGFEYPKDCNYIMDKISSSLVIQKLEELGVV
jgi:ADP-heptose:LPS heptosyltransferase